MISLVDFVAFMDKLSADVALCPPNADPLVYVQKLISINRDMVSKDVDTDAETSDAAFFADVAEPQAPVLLLGTPLFSHAASVIRVVKNRLGANQLARLIKEKCKVKGTISEVRARLIAEMEQAEAYGVRAHVVQNAMSVHGEDVALVSYYFSEEN